MRTAAEIREAWSALIDSYNGGTIQADFESSSLPDELLENFGANLIDELSRVEGISFDAAAAALYLVANTDR